MEPVATGNSLGNLSNAVGGAAWKGVPFNHCSKVLPISSRKSCCTQMKNHLNIKCYCLFFLNHYLCFNQ